MNTNRSQIYIKSIQVDIDNNFAHYKYIKKYLRGIEI